MEDLDPGILLRRLIMRHTMRAGIRIITAVLSLDMDMELDPASISTRARASSWVADDFTGGKYP